MVGDDQEQRLKGLFLLKHCSKFSFFVCNRECSRSTRVVNASALVFINGKVKLLLKMSTPAPKQQVSNNWDL